MDFNNILIGSDNPKALIDYYTKLSASRRWPTRATAAG
jgi:hypothetical protein